MPKDTRLKLAVDDSKMMCGHLRTGTYILRNISCEYPKFIEKKFSMKKPGGVINLESVGSTEREEIRGDFNHGLITKCFTQRSGYSNTVVMVLRNNEVNYSRCSFYNTIIVHKYYHHLADKIFLKHFNFKQTILVVKGTYHYKNWVCL